MPVTLESIVEARELLRDVARVTPVAPAGYLERLVGGPVWLKCENLQVAGSFKVRGAYTRLTHLDAAERARGVVAASAGNHAQGVAVAAQRLGITATVFMPVGAPLPKVTATVDYGAQVELGGDTVDQALEEAAAFAERTGATLIHPFDHEDVVAGQGTVALEILEQVPDVATVLVCVGGGGLVAGIATALAQLRPGVRVVGAQAEKAACYPPSLAAGEPRALNGMATMADGIAVGRPGRIPFAIIRDLGLQITTVSEESISHALLMALERSKLLVEPAGAAALACLLDHPAAFTPPVVVVLSGGNVDPLLLVRVIAHGMIAGGRYLSVRVRLPDHPGALAAMLAVVGREAADVDVVEHVRTSPGLAVGECDVVLQLETRGLAHSQRVLAALDAAGYRTWATLPGTA